MAHCAGISVGVVLLNDSWVRSKQSLSFRSFQKLLNCPVFLRREWVEAGLCLNPLSRLFRALAAAPATAWPKYSHLPASFWVWGISSHESRIFPPTLVLYRYKDATTDSQIINEFYKGLGAKEKERISNGNRSFKFPLPLDSQGSISRIPFLFFRQTNTLFLTMVKRFWP